MANVSKAAKAQLLTDHDYNLTALREACEEEEIEEMEEENRKMSHNHTPLPSPNPKKMKSKNQDVGKQRGEITNETSLDAIQTLIKRFDEQDDRLKAFESRMEANTQAVRENKEEISKVNEEMLLLKKENASLKQICLEQARYKRRWDLRLMGLPEKDKEDTRETVIGILTRVIPVSVEKLCESVDTVHRLGKKNDAATNRMPRPIIIQFALRTVRDEVWRRSREARVCREMNIQFKEDFSKEDREARAKLWPKVQEARRNGKKASLREGYALIDGRRVDP
ncbi:DNA replication factor Cdt1 [Labeo rohita]|uniref:DNA replication factor Cdt1 n=1 Tax=Labeo rohita TaxID=84645 RepID=A0ABQ8KZY1_LABRO|nr:DNA replication factor Cdt1 [Labeo rohita]